MGKMKSQPFWKNWLSYLWEIHIESLPSELNPHLYVSLKNGRYQLCTANAVYSYDELYNNFGDLFPLLKMDQLPGNHVLVLGFGLGSVPLILEKQFGPVYEFTGIELDESVIELASKYTLPRLNSVVHLIRSDAGQFIGISEEQFDLIAIDIFLDDLIPKVFRTEGFLKNVKSRLTENGLVIMNTLAATEADKKASDRFFNNVFVKVFPDGRAVSIPGNLMLISSSSYLK